MTQRLPSPGSVFSPSDLLENQFVDREISNGSLQPGVLRLQFFQPPGLIDFHPPVDLAPAIVGLVADADLLAGRADGFPLAQQNVGFAELGNDLFGAVPFLRQGSDLLSWLFTSFDLDPIFRARSREGAFCHVAGRLGPNWARRRHSASNVWASGYSKQGDG